MTENFLHRMRRWMDDSAGYVSGAPRVTISGGNQVLIEGHKGLLEYADDRIAAAGVGCRILIKGEKLGLVAMDRDALVVSGQLWAVELE